MAPSVLVVEDDDAYRAILRRAVRTWFPGSNVLEAPNLVGAALTPWNSLALVILDLNLPDGSGVDLLRAAVGRAAKILVVTDRQDDKDIATCLDLGVADFVTKPVDLNVLESKVRSLLEKHYVSPFRFQGGKAVEKPVTLSREVRLKSLSMGAIELEAPFFVPRGLEFRVTLWPEGEESTLRVRTAYVRYEPSSGRYLILAEIDLDDQSPQQISALGYRIKILNSSA